MHISTFETYLEDAIRQIEAWEITEQDYAETINC